MLKTFCLFSFRYLRTVKKMKTSKGMHTEVLDETTISSIEHFIKMAMNGKMSWTVVSSIIAEMSMTLQASKQVIKVLLQMLQSKDHANENENYEGEKDVENLNDNTYITSEDSFLKDVETEKRKNNPQLSCLKRNETDFHDNELKNYEDSLETIKKLVESGEKLYTFVGEMIEENNTAQEIIVENYMENDSEQISAKEISPKPKFKRNICGKEFSRKDHLTTHERIHPEIKPLQCYEKSQKQLVAHEAIPRNENTFQCNVCKKIFAHKQYLKKHEVIHSKEKPFQCKNCLKYFTQYQNLKRHEIIHTGEVPFQCKICKKRFNLKGNLKVHKRIHTKKKIFQCNDCVKGFNTKQNLEIHERIHTGEKPLKCETCSKTFRSPSYLTIHHRIHTGERPYKCQTCNKCFISNSALNLHEKSTHIPSQS